MGIPFSVKPIPGIVVDGGTPLTFAIPNVPARSHINRIVCVQVDGTPANFTLVLYQNESVLGEGGPVSESLGSGGRMGNIAEDCHRVTGDLAGSAGKLLYFSENANGGCGFSFAPLEKSRNDMKSQGTLYARITSVGTGQMTFNLAIGGVTEV